MPARATTPEEAFSMLCDRTVFFFDQGHGNQIEYFSPDGRAQLWYPGNTRVNSGRWKIRSHDRVPERTELCFLYGKRSFNPLTKEWGGQWRCRSFEIGYQKTVEARSIVGDIFGLSDNTIPMVLPAKPQIDPDQFRSSASYDISPSARSPAYTSPTS